MKAGRLREHVSFRRRSASVNDFGESKGVWTTITEVWASVEPLSGREFFSAQQVQSEITTRITCRYASAIADITTKDRIQHGSALYDIRSVIDVDMRHREMQFMCTQHID